MNYLAPHQPLLVIIGPSGAGKSKLVTDLVRTGLLELTASWTTRPLRQEEKDAIDHKFVSNTEFESLKLSGFFLETVELFNSPYQYGLPRVVHDTNLSVPVVMLRSMILPQIHKYYSNVRVYQIEADRPVAKKRLSERESNKEVINNRLKDYDKELESGRKMSDRIFVNNGDYEALVQKVKDSLREDFGLSTPS